jgi:hypothetical protein
VVLDVRIHTLPGCDLGTGAARASLTLTALGDFGASNESAEILPLDRAGQELRFPSATRAVEAILGSRPAFFGYGERGELGVDVLLWPERQTCVLLAPDGAQGYPGRNGGQALGYAPGARQVLAAGGNDALLSDAIVGALTFDVNNGALRSFDTSEEGVLAQPRAFATVTVFGDELLVAGGEHPVFGVAEEDIEPRRNAEIFDPELQRFSGVIELQNSRTHHAALTLRDGRTLLIGGRSKAGESNVAQRVLELVDPGEKTARFGEQISGRIDPRALLLSDGRVFVGGGTDAQGKLVSPPGQWLSATAEPERELDEAELPLRFDRAFAALEGSGVLAVGGCEERVPADEDEAARCAEQCRRGCPPAEYDARWIDAEGRGHDVSLPGILAPRPILLPGSDGSPWLVAASERDPSRPALYRFNPWRSTFTAVFAPGELVLPSPDFPPPLAIAPDTFVWLDETAQHGELRGLRLGTRNRFAQDIALVLQADPLDSTRPVHLVPTRPLRGEESYGRTLVLDGDARPPLVVRLTDTDYADVTVTVALQPGSAPPAILLDDQELGESCAWPEGELRGGDADVAKLVRSGARAELYFHGGKQACSAPKSRVSLGFLAITGMTTIDRIEVEREAKAF